MICLTLLDISSCSTASATLTKWCHKTVKTHVHNCDILVVDLSLTYTQAHTHKHTHTHRKTRRKSFKEAYKIWVCVYFSIENQMTIESLIWVLFKEHSNIMWPPCLWSECSSYCWFRQTDRQTDSAEHNHDQSVKKKGKWKKIIYPLLLTNNSLVLIT